MSKLQQSYFHKDLGFDYEKFFYSVLSTACNKFTYISSYQNLPLHIAY